VFPVVASTTGAALLVVSLTSPDGVSVWDVGMLGDVGWGPAFRSALIRSVSQATSRSTDSMECRRSSER
jgi:hypothetical protein